MMSQVWDVRTYRCTRTITGLQHWVRCLQVTDDILFAGSHATLHMWHTGSGQQRGVINTLYGSLHSVAITPKYIVTGTYNRVCTLLWLDIIFHIVNYQEGGSCIRYCL